MCFLTFYMIMCTLMYYIAFFHMNQGGFCIGYLKVVFHNILQRLSANTIHRIKKGLLITTKTLDELCYLLKKEPISRFLFSAPADFFTNSIFLFVAKLRYLREARQIITQYDVSQHIYGSAGSSLRSGRFRAMVHRTI